MKIDHIFIFTNDQDKIASKLVSFGLTEGSSRIHEGQGTSNRTFVFDNFYLEILWVHNKQEIQSEMVKPTGLWKRANYKAYNCSPFGLCLGNSNETKQLFRNAYKYQPGYLPNGLNIDMLNNENNLNLPLTFRLPIKREGKMKTKPSIHKNGITVLTEAEFRYTGVPDKCFLDFFENEDIIKFSRTDKVWLNLTFDNGNQGQTKIFEDLKLTIIY